MKTVCLVGRFALAAVLAAALVALACYAAGARVKQWLGAERLQAERGHRL